MGFTILDGSHMRLPRQERSMRAGRLGRLAGLALALAFAIGVVAGSGGFTTMGFEWSAPLAGFEWSVSSTP
ncbi:hypothetical protein Prum_034900 [Phytohabitans rumicis]|uniref:Uncharacterized protein n=1 Tax=Phytohabitans rumicis TaxID=1076125 RepID=A0A6V8L4G0_9ACTN|nr:hypothetical protein Prum_034900 [Phytohabitans rumicis]